MKLRLYTSDYPSGRCMLLAVHLVKVAAHGRAGIETAERLFDNQHSRGNPAEVIVADPDALEGLRAVCADFGIALEVSEM